jgi:hypothetical protein
MFFENINRKALVSFIIFCIVLAKDILVSDLKIILVRSPLNRAISWFIILPITVIGIIYSIQFIRKCYFKNSKVNNRQLDVNTFLALPILLYVLYVLLVG